MFPRRHASVVYGGQTGRVDDEVLSDRFLINQVLQVIVCCLVASQLVFHSSGDDHRDVGRGRRALQQAFDSVWQHARSLSGERSAWPLVAHREIVHPFAKLFVVPRFAAKWCEHPVGTVGRFSFRSVGIA